MGNFNENKINRQSAGTSAGGQFANKDHPANGGVGLGLVPPLPEGAVGPPSDAQVQEIGYPWGGSRTTYSDSNGEILYEESRDRQGELKNALDLREGDRVTAIDYRGGIPVGGVERWGNYAFEVSFDEEGRVCGRTSLGDPGDARVGKMQVTEVVGSNGVARREMRNAQGRLHNASGPAIVLKNGRSIFVQNGPKSIEDDPGLKDHPYLNS